MTMSIAGSLALLMILGQAPASKQAVASFEGAARLEQLEAKFQGDCGGRDPYCNLWREVQQKDAEWRQIDEGLEMSLARLTPCSPETLDALQQVKQAMSQSFAKQGEYYRKWRELAQGDGQLFARLLAERGSLRTEIETSMAQVERQLADLEKRKVALAQAIQGSGAETDGKEMRALNALIESSRERVENLYGALRRWEEAERYNVQSMRNLQELEERIDLMQHLLLSESLHWQSYYEAREARVRLQCVNDREPQRPIRRRPPIQF